MKSLNLTGTKEDKILKSEVLKLQGKKGIYAKK